MSGSNKSNSFGRYVRYAFGEIILVVIGILIALNIKGWYQEEGKGDQLELIAIQIIDDLRRDTADVSIMVKSYEPLRKRFLGIINKSYNLDSLKNCPECPYLFSSVAPFVPNQHGYIQLEDWEASYETRRDSLIHDTKVFYAQTVPTMELISRMLEEDVKDNLKEWRDNYEWYAYWVNGIRTEEFYT